MTIDQIAALLCSLPSIQFVAGWLFDLRVAVARFDSSSMVGVVSGGRTLSDHFTYMNDQWAVAIASSLVGVAGGFILTAGWDAYKNHKRFVALIGALILELEANAKRSHDVLDGLPPDIRLHFDAGTDVQLTDVQVRSISWGFPKPYALDAWRTIVTAGFVPNVPSDLLKDIQKIYNHIESINFLADLALKTFAIIAVPNNLDPATNQNLDRFCRMGTKSMEAVLVKLVGDIPGRLRKITGARWRWI